MEIVVLVVFVAFVVYKLGLFKPITDLADVANRETSVYNREHKARVAKRYESLLVDVDVERVNANIKSIEELHFD